MAINIFDLETQDSTQVKACLDIYRPFIADSAVSFETQVPTLEQMTQRIVEVQSNYPWLVLTENDIICGYAYAGRHRAREAYQWCAEVSVYLSPKAVGKGHAKKLYQELFDRLRKQNIYQVFAGITLPNPPSEKFHQKMGFKSIGTYPKIGFKQNEWRDVAWSYLELRDFNETPDKLIPYPEL